MKSPSSVARRRRWRRKTKCLADEAEDATTATPQDASKVLGANESADVVSGAPEVPEEIPVTSVTAPSEPSSTDIMADWIRSLKPHQRFYFYAAVFSLLSFCSTRNLNFLRILPIICIVEVGRHLLIWIIYFTGTAEFEFVTDILIMLGGRAKTEVERTKEGGFFRRRYEAVVLGGANQFGGTAWGVFNGYVHSTHERAKERRDRATEDFLVALQPLKKS